MDTHNTDNHKNFASKIMDGIKKAQQEIEELAVQFSLGKAEAVDKYEEIKKEFSGKAAEWKTKIAAMKTHGEEKITKLRTLFENLELQLALGKADAKDEFEEQRKNILKAIHEVEAEIKSNPEWNERINEFNVEIEKFKLKLEILKLKFELKNFDLKEDINNGISEAEKKIDQVFGKMEEKWDATKEKYSDFGEEISLAYSHLKKAIKGL